MRRAALALLALLALACGRAEPAAPARSDAPPGGAYAPPDGAHAPPGGAHAPPRARVTIGVHVIDAEIADTPARQQRGLSGRPSLPAGQGMLFLYAEPAPRGFWMPDMHFDIDIVWIRAGRIVHVEPDVPHAVSDPLPVYRPSEPADTVLEVVAGTAQRLGWRVGDAVQVERLPR